MRLIDADALIDDCKKYLNSLNPSRDGKECARIHWLIGILSNASPIEPEQKWIPVDIKNDSPEENEVVLLGVRFRDDFKYFVTSRQDYNYWTGLGREINGELRWQPLPEPYQEEGEQDA